jgi:hypothetical protein
LLTTRRIFAWNGRNFPWPGLAETTRPFATRLLKALSIVPELQKDRRRAFFATASRSPFTLGTWQCAGGGIGGLMTWMSCVPELPA